MTFWVGKMLLTKLPATLFTLFIALTIALNFTPAQGFGQDAPFDFNVIAIEDQTITGPSGSTLTLSSLNSPAIALSDAGAVILADTNNGDALIFFDTTSLTSRTLIEFGQVLPGFGSSCILLSPGVNDIGQVAVFARRNGANADTSLIVDTANNDLISLIVEAGATSPNGQLFFRTPCSYWWTQHAGNSARKKCRWFTRGCRWNYHYRRFINGNSSFRSTHIHIRNAGHIASVSFEF